MTIAPRRANSAETVDFPEPIPPVRPSRSIAGTYQSASQCFSAHFAHSFANPADKYCMTNTAMHSTRPALTDWRGYPITVTRREEEVLQAICDGCSTPEVASRLYLSQKTVKNHLASIYQKLDARDRTQAVLTALRLGIVRLD
jgi:DNA-binding NarL/FixJ family response regulator